MGWLQQTPEGVLVRIRVVPNAPRTAVAGVLGDALKIRLQAPPVEGKANLALLDFLAEACGLPRSRLRLAAGQRSRNKSVLLAGASAAVVEAGLTGSSP